ncbi:MAG: hypothetical protein AB7T18_16395, partial [Alphaproteobacteria bacterium]
MLALYCLVAASGAVAQEAAKPADTPNVNAAASDSAAAPASSTGGTDLQSLSEDPKNWPMAPHDYANTRYSALDQINTQNVGQLSLAWSFSLGADRGQEAAPLVIDGTMYVVGPYWGVHPNQVFALD